MSSLSVPVHQPIKTDAVRDANHELLSRALTQNAPVHIVFLAPDGAEHSITGHIAHLADYVVWLGRQDTEQQALGIPNPRRQAFAVREKGVYLRSIQRVEFVLPPNEGDAP